VLYKSCPAQVKAAGPDDGLNEGEYRAVVSVFGNVDSMGDIVLSGAFSETLDEWKRSGNPIPIYWSHQMHDPDYNIGHVVDATETDVGLEVHGKLDLDSPKAKQVYRLLKGRRVTQQSFAYDIIDGGPSEDDPDVFELRTLRIFEVGPTPIGANQETTVLAVKSAISPHATSTVDEAWDGPANEARLSNDAGSATYRKAYAWSDPDGDADAKASYKFLHHNIAEDGSVGAANVRGCIAGIAVLNGSRGGADIPDADRDGVYRHLAKHLSDADMEPPPLKSTSTPTKSGRAISAKNEKALRSAREQLDAAASAIDDVLAALDGETNDDQEKASTRGPAKTDEPAGAKADEPSRSVPVDAWAVQLELAKKGRDVVCR